MIMRWSVCRGGREAGQASNGRVRPRQAQDNGYGCPQGYRLGRRADRRGEARVRWVLGREYDGHSPCLRP